MTVSSPLQAGPQLGKWINLGAWVPPSCPCPQGIRPHDPFEAFKDVDGYIYGREAPRT